MPSTKPTNGHWVPNTDVYSTDTGLVIKVELSGMRCENLEITVQANRICISGDRPDKCRSQAANFLVSEINYGPFESVLELPNGYDINQSRAAFLNGLLRIDIPPGTPPPPGAPPPPPPPPSSQPPSSQPHPKGPKPPGPPPGKIAIECPDKQEA